MVPEELRIKKGGLQDLLKGRMINDNRERKTGFRAPPRTTIFPRPREAHIAADTYSSGWDYELG